MNYITIDAETYWSQDHSLSKMNPIIYSTHPETELISLSYKLNNDQTYTIWGEEAILAWAKTMPWDDLAVIAHNGNGFDHMLLVWRLGAHPKLFCDTLAMARPFHAKDVGGSLKALVKHYGLGVKDATALHQTKGKHLADFTTQEKADMGVYNRMDVDQTWGLFKKLAPLTPPGELKLIDMTARMLVYPQFYVDQQLLTRGLKAERARKHAMLMELAQHLEIVGLTDEDIAAQAKTLLMSAQKFGEILTSRGVPVPMKISPTTGRETPALAKTDEAFTALQDHPDPIVSTAARARLGVKSTILESRIEALLAVSTALDGKMPIPLQYYGADTTGRFSGNMGTNVQNLPRVDPKQPKLSDVLRLSLIAPPEHKVVVADLSGIELRMNHFLWKVPSSMALFRADPEKADLYKEFASKLYNTPKDEVTKAQRHMGKLCVVEGTLVLTNRGEVPIEQVTASDTVWDGVEWVHTLGPVYNGEQEVVAHDGITATPDHIVWVEDGRALPLGAASAQSLRLARTGAGGVPVGFVGTDSDRDYSAHTVSLRASSLHGLRGREADQLRQLTGREDNTVPVLCEEVRRPSMAASANGVSETTLHQSERPRIPSLRGEGDKVLFPERSFGSSVGNGESGAAQEPGAGPHRQQWELRAWEHSLPSSESEHQQPEQLDTAAIPQLSDELSRGSVCRQHTTKLVERGDDRRGDRGSLGGAVVQTKRRVWDLLNCGPRHRFTANGRLISNCHLGLQYGSGPGTFRKVAKTLGGVDLDDNQAAKIVTAWRDAYPEIVEAWATCQNAITDMIRPADSPLPLDPWGLCGTVKHGVRLPQGLMIRYPSLRQEWDDKSQRQNWVYGEGRHKAKLYGSKMVENLIQALSRIALTDIMLAYSKTPLGRRYPIAHCVHDEIVCVTHQDDAQEVLDLLHHLMRTPPTWFPELVTWSEGDIAQRYGNAK